jgi:MFS family permease
MGWDIRVFVVFLIMGGIGGAAAYLVLWYEKRRRGSKSRGLSGVLVIFDAIVAATIVSMITAPVVTGPILRIVSPDDYDTHYRLEDVGLSIWGDIPWGMVVAFVAMLFGMAASYFNKLIEQRRAKIVQLRANGSSAKVTLDFDKWDFVQPFLVSLVTFGAIASRTGGGGDLLQSSS